MKREIKFRGKSKNTGDWLYGVPVKSVNDNMYLIHSATEDAINTFNDVDFVYSEVIPETVGQFTGLKDKNGVEIYEGDVLINLVNGKRWTVVGLQYGFTIECKEYNEKYYLNEYSKILSRNNFKNDFGSYFEIIGNIHDKNKQKQALIDMMRGDEELGLYDDDPQLNGVECPKCGEELYDSNPIKTLTSMPPKKNVHCSKCDYVGYRTE